MSTGEGQTPRDGQAPRDAESRRGERIAVGGPDDSVSRIQLAARWAEAYGGDGDSLAKILKRFRSAYDYLDAVIHGVEPADLEPETSDATPSEAQVTAYAPPSPSPPPPESSQPPAAESRPWS
jgi:hypothetical protein